MANSEQLPILSTVDAEDFFGRETEIDRLLRHAKGEADSLGMLVLSSPGQGLSELLRHTYDQLFYEQDEIIPIYFEVKKSDRSLKELSVRFLQTFLGQLVAFKRNDSKVIHSSPDICEISEIAVPSDGVWVDRLINSCTHESELSNDSAFVRQAFSAALRAEANDVKTFVMIDSLEKIDYLSGNTYLVEELKEIFKRSRVPFVFAGNRRFVLSSMFRGNVKLNDADVIQLNRHTFENGGELLEHFAGKHNVLITEQTRDLMVRQFDSNPAFLKSIIETASARKTHLDSFQKVQKLYVEEVFGGKFKAFYDSIFNEIIPNGETQKAFISLMYNNLTGLKKKETVESWRRHTNLDESKFSRAINLLNANEIVTVSSNMIEANVSNEILTDYVTKRFRLEIRGDSRALAVAETLSEFLKRAPVKMAEFYRDKSAFGIRELLTAFDCQKVPLSLLFYNVFKETHKGKEEKEVLNDVNEDPEKVTLPQIVYTANTVALYSPISKLTEKERSAVALGFEAAEYKDENEIVWIAAEIDSKLEAEADLTTFWCDRLEMVALMCDFKNYRLWLISPEGFSPEAVEVLNDRSAIGSSRQQVELLVKHLDLENILTSSDSDKEFEMVIPMGEDTELIAAYAVEELARRHSFESKAINQIKTALVEACINATEHSHSPDRKIYQKFNLEDNKIRITISNRGLRFKGKETKEINPNEGRRGWGLKLMRSLMDEVKFEQVDDGTKISLVKYLNK